MAVPDLAGAVVLVTGASSGMGEATARALHEAGAVPVLAARRADRLEALSAELGGALALTIDVTQPDDVARMVRETLATHGRIDGLVNNAGASLSADVSDVDLDAFRRVLELNVVAPVAVLQAVVPALRASGGGTIVDVSSGTTRRVAVGLAPYAATKSALNMLTLAARAELAGDAIDVLVDRPVHHLDRVRRRDVPGPDAPSGDRAPHSPEFVAAVILRMLQTGEERIDLLPGPEDWALARLP